VALLLAPAAAAAQLGREAPLATARGFAGRMEVSPEHGSAGTPVRVAAEGLPADTEFQLVWRTVRGSWEVGQGGYYGLEYAPAAFEITTVRSDTAGRLRLSARRRAAAGRAPLHPGRVCCRHVGDIVPRKRSGRDADQGRGQGHRLAPARK